jgi:TMEM164 family
VPDSLSCCIIHQIYLLGEAAMGEYFARDYHGETFQLFGPPHLVALSIVLLIVLLVIYFRKEFSPRTRLITRFSLATILVLNELGWHAWNYFTGQWTIQTMLPPHMEIGHPCNGLDECLYGCYRDYQLADR